MPRAVDDAFALWLILCPIIITVIYARVTTMANFHNVFMRKLDLIKIDVNSTVNLGNNFHRFSNLDDKFKSSIVVIVTNSRTVSIM